MIHLARTFHMDEFPRFVPPSENLMGGGTLIRCTEKRMPIWQFWFCMQEVTSYFIPLLKSPTFYHGREIGATQNHGWSTLRDLAAKVQFYVESWTFSVRFFVFMLFYSTFFYISYYLGTHFHHSKVALCNTYISSKDSEPRWMLSFRSSGVWLSTLFTFSRNSSSLYL